MFRRVLAVAALLLMIVAVPTAPALAVEEDEGAGADHHDLPSISEVGTQSEISKRFFPEEAEEAPFEDALIYPLMAVGVIVVLVVLALYLKWQPSFAEEERTRRR